MRVLAGFFLLCSLVCAERDGRWFSRETRTVTKVVRERQLVTESTPSSCVVVETMLPPCRHLRAVPIQPTQTQRIMETVPPVPMNKPENQGWRPILQPSDPIPPLPTKKPAKPTPPMTHTTPSTSGWSWNNIFNLGPKEIVVTQTLREIYTTKYMDPNTVVTFSVKGCRPSRLPFDLPECEPPRSLPLPEVPEAPESGVIVMAPIQFVQGMSPLKMAAAQPLPQQMKPAELVQADTSGAVEKEEDGEELKKEVQTDVKKTENKGTTV